MQQSQKATADMSIEINKIELMALKKLAIISGALAASLKDLNSAREQRALTKVLCDVINRAKLENATADARS